MPVTKPIPIRLEPEIIAALDDAACALGTNRAALVRHLLTTFLRHYDAGAGTLPADWRRMLAGEERASGPRPGQPPRRVVYSPPAPAAAAMNDRNSLTTADE